VHALYHAQTWCVPIVVTFDSCACRKMGYPLMLKARGNSYDGKGNAVVKTEADAQAAFDQLTKTSDRVREIPYTHTFCGPLGLASNDAFYDDMSYT
jgi:hypothetical protein